MDPEEQENTSTTAEQETQPADAEGLQENGQTETLSRMALVQAQTERELRELRSQMRERDEQLAGLQASHATLESLRESVKKGDYSGLEKELGADYARWTESELEKPSKDQQEVLALQARLEALESSSKKAQEREQAVQKAQQETERAELLQKRRAYVRDEMVGKAEGESMGFIDALGATDRVIATFDQAYKDTGIEPNEATIATRVEKELTGELTQSLENLLKLDKFRTLVTQMLKQDNDTQQAAQGTPRLDLSNADLAETTRSGDRANLGDKEAEAKAFAAMDRVISQMG